MKPLISLRVVLYGVVQKGPANVLRLYTYEHTLFVYYKLSTGKLRLL